MSKYERGKDNARAEASAYWASFTYGTTYYWSGIADITEYFTKLGKRYGLLREFRENGII